MAYRILAWFLRVVSRVSFRQVEVVGLEESWRARRNADLDAELDRE